MIAKVASAVVAVCIVFAFGYWLGCIRWRKSISEINEKIKRIKKLLSESEDTE